jgi:hypothetical protein
MCPSITKTLCIVLLFLSMAATDVSSSLAQSLPVPGPGVQVAPSSAGAAGVQAAATSGQVVPPGVGIGGQLGQGVVPGGRQNGQGMGPVRLPNQNCGGMGQCAWSGQSQATAACTPDARVCASTSTDPDWSGTRCSATGAQRTCTNSTGGLIIQNSLPGTNSNGGLIIQNALPGTIGTNTPGTGLPTGTGIAPNGQPGTGGSSTGNTSTLPGLCNNC